MRVLVTGGNGFVGSHLVAALRARGDEVVSAGQGPSTPSHVAIDLADAESSRTVVGAARPEVIFHLAARTFVPDAIASPLATYEANAMGTARLVEAARELPILAKIVFASTAEVYGTRPETDNPLREDLPLHPLTPYGASKVAAEAILAASARTFGIGVVVARCFNMIGPGQDARFVVPSFARQLAEIAAGAEPVLRVGNLEAERDFLDVRDAVAAFVTLSDGGESGEAYNVCSGRAVAIAEVLRMLIEIAGVRVEVREDPSRMRPSDNPLSVGDPAKIRAKTGWEPQYSLEATLRDVYADAKERLAAGR